MKMKHMALVCAAIGFLALSSPQTAEAQPARTDIVFIHLDNVFTNYTKTKLAEATLKEQAEEVQAERKAMITEYRALKEEQEALQAQSKSALLNDEARAEKRGEAEEKLIEIKRLEREIAKLEENARKQFDEQSRRARTRLVSEINEVIRDYAKEKELIAIIDISGESLNGVPTVVYYQPELDITEDIILLINK